MNKELEDKFRKKAEKLGYKVQDYSGRYMFSRECPGVVVDNPKDFIAEIGLKGLRVDNMGLQYIVYTG